MWYRTATSSSFASTSEASSAKARFSFCVVGGAQQDRAEHHINPRDQGLRAEPAHGPELLSDHGLATLAKPSSATVRLLLASGYATPGAGRFGSPRHRVKRASLTPLGVLESRPNAGGPEPKSDPAIGRPPERTCTLPYVHVRFIFADLAVESGTGPAEGCGQRHYPSAAVREGGLVHPGDAQHLIAPSPGVPQIGLMPGRVEHGVAEFAEGRNQPRSDF